MLFILLESYGNTMNYIERFVSKYEIGRIAIVVLTLGIILPLLFACSYAFDILVSDLSTNVPTFSFRKRIITQSPAKYTNGYKIFSFSVNINITDDSGRMPPVWQLRVEPGYEGVFVENIKYGVVPEHFKEITPAEPLKFGVTYYVGASTSDGGGAQDAFILNETQQKSQ